MSADKEATFQAPLAVTSLENFPLLRQYCIIGPVSKLLVEIFQIWSPNDRSSRRNLNVCQASTCESLWEAKLAFSIPFVAQIWRLCSLLIPGIAASSHTQALILCKYYAWSFRAQVVGQVERVIYGPGNMLLANWPCSEPKQFTIVVDMEQFCVIECLKTRTRDEIGRVEMPEDNKSR